MRSTPQEFSVIIEQDTEGFYVASVPSIQGCHTQAKSLDEVMERIKEAIAVCLDEETEQTNLRFIGVQRVTV
ncbi:MAG TPA: type II toxin-antitoxin system HicB family antitoxin [Methylomirabilota bacterium]|nr:type II toxin-antitoxin system HicB family antitoxin [Methylomirabilota bacterium]